MHSITVEDIRYFFDPDFPVNNSVPTVNMDLEGDHIVMAQSVPSEFKFPGKQYLMFSRVSNSGSDFGKRIWIQGTTVCRKYPLCKKSWMRSIKKWGR